MTDTMHELERFAVPLPIAQASRHLAQQFAAEQPNLEKADRVRRNTLAVCTVRDYLQLMAIETNPAASDSWNTLMRLLSDVADLELPGAGRLECRPIAKGDANCHIPPDVWADRLGYVVVALDETMQEASIVGFTHHTATETLPLNQLQPPEALLDAIAATAIVAPAIGQPVTHLSQWFQNQFDAAWKSLETLVLPSLTPAFRNRSQADLDQDPTETSLWRGKRLNLGMHTGTQAMALLIEIQPEADQAFAVLLQVVPADATYLAANVELTVLDETDADYLQARSRQADDYIQLRFNGVAGEAFSVRVSLDEASVTEQFVL